MKNFILLIIGIGILVLLFTNRWSGFLQALQGNNSGVFK